MSEKRNKKRILLLSVFWALMLGSLALPLFVAPIRQFYIDFAQGHLGSAAQGQILLCFGTAAALVLTLHLLSTRHRPLTTCLILSLVLHMVLVALFSLIGFRGNVLLAAREEPPVLITFGVPTDLETEASEAVRDDLLNLERPVVKEFESPARRELPPDRTDVRMELKPQELESSANQSSLVKTELAAKPSVTVQDLPKPQAEGSVDISKPVIAKARTVEQAEDSPEARRDLVSLAAAKQESGVRVADPTKLEMPRQRAEDPRRDPLKEQMENERLAGGDTSVREDLREAQIRQATVRLPAQPVSTAIGSATEEPGPAPMAPAARIDVGKQEGRAGSGQTFRPDLDVKLELDTRRAASLAGNDPDTLSRAVASPQRGTDLSPGTAGRATDEPLRLGGRATELATASTEQPSARPGPAGELRTPGRRQASSDSWAEVLARPSRGMRAGRSDAVAGSLVTAATQSGNGTEGRGGPEVNAGISRGTTAAGSGGTMRGIGARTATLASGSGDGAGGSGSGSGGGPAGEAGRTFEVASAHGGGPAPEGELVSQLKRIFSPGGTGDGTRHETLAGGNLAPLSTAGATAPTGAEGGGRGTGRAGRGTVDRATVGIGGQAALVQGTTDAGGGGDGKGSGGTGQSNLAPGRTAWAPSGTGGGGVGGLAPLREGAGTATAGSLVAELADVFSSKASPGSPRESGAGDGGVALPKGRDLAGVRLGPGTAAATATSDQPDLPVGTAAQNSRSLPSGMQVGKATGGGYGSAGVPSPIASSPSAAALQGSGSGQAQQAARLIGSQEGMSALAGGGRAVLRDIEPDSAAYGPPGGSRGARESTVALAFGAPMAGAGVGGGTVAGGGTAAGTAAPGGGQGGAAARGSVGGVAKATSGIGSADSSAGGLPSGAGVPGERTEGRQPSRLFSWFTGSGHAGKLSIADDLPRGDRVAAYRSVSAAEMKASPKLQPQKLIYSLRSPEKRKELIRELGGNPDTEKAVELALGWLSKAQSPDGHWDVDQFQLADVCGGRGDRTDGDVGVTGLALLSYLGAGYTHRRGDYQETIRKGLEWLIAGETAQGDIRRGGPLYCQAMGAAAICEALSLSDDEKLREPAERAIRFICESQNPNAGWRYEPREDSDTSVTGWQILALKSAEISGIKIPSKHFDWTAEWLEKVRQGQAGGLYSYKEGHGTTPVMTAEGWFCQLFMGEKMRTRGEAESVNYLLENLPVWDMEVKGMIHFYYWYYATLAMHLSGAEAFDKWNKALRSALLKGQREDGPAAGSWDPVDQLGERGGRLYSTTMATLCLEVYYRYLPFYRTGSSSEPAQGEAPR